MIVREIPIAADHNGHPSKKQTQSFRRHSVLPVRSWPKLGLERRAKRNAGSKQIVHCDFRKPALCPCCHSHSARPIAPLRHASEHPLGRTSLMGACDLVPLPLVWPRPTGTPCRGFAFIMFDVRGLVVASAAAVEEKNHKAAADDHGKKDAEPIISQPHAGMVTSPAETQP